MEYRMQNCRSLLEQISVGDDDLNIVLIGEIERAVINQNNSVFCLSYGLIDTMCKTILNVRDEEDNEKDDLPTRFKRVMNVLNLVPQGYGTRKHEGIDHVIYGLERSVRGLCELRNKDGIVSHGKSADTKPMDLLQLQFTAQTTDLLVHYLYQAHLDYPMPTVEITYNDNPEFNEYVDESFNEYEIFGQTLLPSYILFTADIDHIAYKEALEYYRLEMQEQVTEIE